ncbi:GspE/PulE family protein [Pseudoramibacter sp.]|jgi:type II secretory ATPase GspE/PulE/Tfp pilus assembly ATPase PilB-like protein|uniref:GspE/PulE family protein n=1 Tax=Pseudoramibacter sp. TaxID=2034862 RepID=UPI0025E1217D|nr:GspE/PulE family protein [Pseudoramibacter sp.]MCH4071982.1 GspE/PulE family protein [Pseudoramibacter sp.]MCH4105751.1 GspE/PulE family protein [Pseudoramibacter sp.]
MKKTWHKHASDDRRAAKKRMIDQRKKRDGIVRLTDELLTQALSQRVSDIHLEPMGPESYRVRFRIDGALFLYTKLSSEDYTSMISRIKILAQMDISDRRSVQDGAFVFRDIPMRVSVLPTVHGEHMVIRILDSRYYIQDLARLGLLPEQTAKLDAMTAKNEGLILISGPTGSGKTTTLFSIANRLNREARHVVSLEEPAEILIPGVTQVSLSGVRDFSFEKGVRAVLRQDPDIIILGEIRDAPSARAAIRAAATGHLCFATIHARSAWGCRERLLDFGVPDYMADDQLIGLMAQRLVPRICPACGKVVDMSEDQRRKLNLSRRGKLRIGEGCPACRHTGRAGRIGLFEVVDPLRDGKTPRPFRASAVAHLKKGRVAYDDVAHYL